MRGQGRLGGYSVVRECDRAVWGAGSHQRGVPQDSQRRWFWEEARPATCVAHQPHHFPCCLQPALCAPSPLSPLLSAGLTSTGRCPRTLRSRRTPGPLVSSRPSHRCPPHPLPALPVQNAGPGREEGMGICQALHMVPHLVSVLTGTLQAAGIICFWKEMPETINSSFRGRGNGAQGWEGA